MDGEKRPIEPRLLRIVLEQTRTARDRQINNLMSLKKYKGIETAELLLKILQQDAAQTAKPENFYLKETKTWFKGVSLGTLDLSTPKGRITLATIYDIDVGQFRFCAELKQLQYGKEIRFQLEDPEENGHELFFEKGTREQQQTLLLGVLDVIFEARQDELAPSVA